MPFLPRILAADGSPGDIHLLAEAFADSGYPVVLEGAITGTDAIARIERRGRHATRTDDLDLVLIDLRVVRVSGKQVLTWIKGQPRYRELVVVTCATDMSPAEYSECMSLGANCSLVKPTTFDDYAPFIERLVGKLVERCDDSSRYA